MKAKLSVFKQARIHSGCGLGSEIMLSCATLFQWRMHRYNHQSKAPSLIAA